VNGEVLGQGKTVAVPALFGVLLGHHFGLVGNLVQVGDQLGNAERGGAARHAGDPRVGSSGVAGLWRQLVDLPSHEHTIGICLVAAKRRAWNEPK